MKKDRKKFTVKGIGIVAALLISVGIFTLISYDSPESTSGNQGALDGNEYRGVKIPAIQLPKVTSNADMVGLIVYNGKIYTQTNTEINAADAKAILDDKLGTTKGTIDEWSKQKEYDDELASTIGKMDVYSVKGYDKNFRITVYQEQDGNQYTEFYENLNGITIRSGEDVFGKLNMVGNIDSAKWRTFSETYSSIDNDNEVLDIEVVNTFLEELNKTKPLPRKQNSDPITNARNNEEYRELTLKLTDGSTVNLTLLKEGYIYYGITDVYFEMEKNAFSILWNLLT